MITYRKLLNAIETAKELNSEVEYIKSIRRWKGTPQQQDEDEDEAAILTAEEKLDQKIDWD